MSSAKVVSNKKDYSIIFEQIEAFKNCPDYLIIDDTICTVRELQDPIESLRQIVMDKEDYDYRVITLT